MQARIYQPTRTAMQSGRGRVKYWVLEYEPVTARRPEPLMGWTSSGDTMNQVRLRFPTLEEAVAFATREGIPYAVSQPHVRRIPPKNYSDNFRPRPDR